MTALDDITTGQRGIAGVVSRLAERFGPVTRRSALVGAAVAGSALATKPREYALRPVTAYASICGPGNTAASGWTVFCCTINKGVNACPPGSFAAGWWRAADSSWCGGGSRYIVDCNATCSKCTSGCSDHICDSRCWSCSCGTGSSATCDQRRVCCNAFRYGQCNTHVKCSGGVHCRVVSCVPPYHWANCTTTALRDDRTKEHSAPCLPKWSYVALKYRQMGEHGSYLRASLGPERSVGDGRGQYVLYQGGAIYWTSSTGAHAMIPWVHQVWQQWGGPRGVLGYPTQDRYTTVNNGWIQTFQGGVIIDSANTSTAYVYSSAYHEWARYGRERGVLGYPTTNRLVKDGGKGWLQMFQNGAIADSTATGVFHVANPAFTIWTNYGRQAGLLGYPTSNRLNRPDGSWVQLFQNGAIADSGATPILAVHSVMYTAWVDAGRESGVLRFPASGLLIEGRGRHQVFQGGELWALEDRPARRVYGAVLAEWKSQGGAEGRYGYPVTDTVPTAGGRLTCTFENGTITA